MSLKTYKYRVGGSALRCLSEGSLFFSSPQMLNDILEVKFDVSCPREFYSEYISCLNEIAVMRGLELIGTMPESLSQEFMSEIENENLRFIDSCRNGGIFSSSARHDNQSLWAYYSNEFKGVCFELDWTPDVLEKYNLLAGEVLYSKEQKIINRAKTIKEILIEVAKENPSWTIKELIQLSMTEEFRREYGRAAQFKAMSIKHEDWRHEQEVRIISPQAGSLSILYDVLKRVFFVNADFPEYISIVRILHQLYPNVEMVQLEFHHVEPFIRSKEITAKCIPVTS